MVGLLLPEGDGGSLVPAAVRGDGLERLAGLELPPTGALAALLAGLERPVVRRDLERFPDLAGEVAPFVAEGVALLVPLRGPDGLEGTAGAGRAPRRAAVPGGRARGAGEPRALRGRGAPPSAARAGARGAGARGAGRARRRERRGAPGADRDGLPRGARRARDAGAAASAPAAGARHPAGPGRGCGGRGGGARAAGRGRPDRDRPRPRGALRAGGGSAPVAGTTSPRPGTHGPRRCWRWRSCTRRSAGAARTRGPRWRGPWPRPARGSTRSRARRSKPPRASWRC